MQQPLILQWIETIGGLVVSMPFLVILALLIFWKPLKDILEKFKSGEISRIKIIDIELERQQLQQVTHDLNKTKDLTERINVKMLESRRLELEIIEPLLLLMSTNMTPPIVTSPELLKKVQGSIASGPEMLKKLQRDKNEMDKLLREVQEIKETDQGEFGENK